MTRVAPPRWSDERLEEDSQKAIEQFREVRMHEPLEQYLEVFDEYRETVESLIEGTVDLTTLSDQAVEYLTDPNLLTAVRYLASPAISEDDLKTLAEAVLTPTRLKKDAGMARRVVDTVLLGLDRNRFPWVTERREPTEVERSIAVTSTAALIATQKVQTSRRNEAKAEQEGATADVLLANGFTRVSERRVETDADLPGPGEFCGESQFGSRKADLIVRLWDNRTMPCECKVSNSSTNSVKRLNNDAAVKAGTWTKEFGENNVVPVAVLSGVFKVHNLRAAQDAGLTLFWAHGFDAMVEFVEHTRS